MKVVGIIAEYNPFHNGHKMQLQYAKDTLGADYIIIAMSGNFTQRGIPAVMDKYTRARHALQAGADLVLELPTVGATASAAEFAKCGVNSLIATGIVTDLLFGAETPEISRFEKVSELLEHESFLYRRHLREYLRDGFSFAKARAMAIDKVYPNEGYDVFLKKPNNILGIEYIRALHESVYAKDAIESIRVHAMKRIEADDKMLSDMKMSVTSSTVIRQKLELGTFEETEGFVPETVYDKVLEMQSDNLLLYTNDFSLLLHDRLLRSGNFANYMEANTDLARRILKSRRLFTNYRAFAENLKTKNVTHSHIMRVLSHILLSISKEDHAILKAYGYAPYLHILDYKKDAKRLVHALWNKATPAMFHSPKEASKILDAKAWSVYSKDLIAADVYRMIQTQKAAQSFPTEYTRYFEPL